MYRTVTASKTILQCKRQVAGDAAQWPGHASPLQTVNMLLDYRLILREPGQVKRQGAGGQGREGRSGAGEREAGQEEICIRHMPQRSLEDSGASLPPWSPSRSSQDGTSDDYSVHA